MPSKFKPSRQRKHKVLARQNGNGAHLNGASVGDHTDASNPLIVTESKSVREQRRQQLRDELREQQRKPQISAKKQKRLDKYIENKLKKEENLDLVKKLEQEKLKYDARGLQSSKNLKKRAFDQYVEGQVSNSGGVVVEEIRSSVKTKKSQEQDSDNDSEDSFEETHPEAFSEDAVAAPIDDASWFKNKPAVTSGGTGLAQPLAIGPDGLPVIPSRNSKRSKQPARQPATESPVSATMVNGEDEEPWEGFSSEPESIDEEESDATTDESDLNDTSDDDTGDDGSDDATDDSDSESTSASEDLDDVRTKLKTRSSAFKMWATQRVNESIGHTPSYSLTDDADGVQLPSTGIKPAAGYRLGVEDVEKNRPKQVPHVVQVDRNEAIDESRSQLPILQREQEIMEAIKNNPVVVLKGETGSGKTTQIPQFLYEAGYGDSNGPNPGMIGITQPRRVAAVSMAKRVAEELESHGSRVAHQIRFDTNVSSNTAIKFMTDGVLLRELSQDLLLKKYSVIVIDEAHERSSNTDILIGMLSKIVPARMKKTAHNPDPKPLKLIIMSATLNVADFLHEKLFDSAHRPPVVEAEGRQHRVTTHFALRSRPDYIEETIEKVKRAHRKLPRGGMLVFLTGQNEIKQVLARLRSELKQSSATTSGTTPSMHISGADAPLEFEDFDIGVEARHSTDDDFEDEIKIFADEEYADAEFEISDVEDDDQETGEEQKQATSEELLSGRTSKQNRDPYDAVHILPLYSQLPTTEQLRVFETPPDRSRLIVLATNVAETALTIPGIRYVFDCGRSKERNYNVETNVQSFNIDYISKASAQQRAGRAGRTGPGHCWRLYSSAVYEQYFPEHTEPEILRMPAESIVLQLKSFKYPKPVIEFPFPSAPSASTLQQAEKLLRNLGALHGNTVTELGKSLSTLPIAPRLGKIVTTALAVPKVLLEAILLVSVLSVDDIFISNVQAISEDDDESGNDLDSRKQQYGRVQATLSKSDKTSDMLKMYTALALYTAQPESGRNKFCAEHYLRPKAMLEAYQLSTQLRRLVQASHPGVFQRGSTAKNNLSSSQVRTLNAVGSSGFTDQIAIRHDLHPTPPLLERKPRRAIDVPYLPLTPLNKNVTNSTPLGERAVFVHPTSVLSRLTISSLPPFVIYRHLQRSQPTNITSAAAEAHTTKTRMLPLTPVHSAKDLLELVKDTSLIQYGKPVPKTQIEELSGKPKKRVCWITCEVRDRDAATNNCVGTGWPLPPIKVRQIMDLKDPFGWRVEEVLA